MVLLFYVHISECILPFSLCKDYYVHTDTFCIYYNIYICVTCTHTYIYDNIDQGCATFFVSGPSSDLIHQPGAKHFSNVVTFYTIN